MEVAMQGWPLGRRRTIQLLLILTLLAWATQTLFQQWGFGAEPVAEKFVPGTSRFAAGATLELRAEATVIGGEVTLRQVCRWTEADAHAFVSLGDLVIARLTAADPFRRITVQEVRQTLADAGANLAVIKLAGSASCTVSRRDVAFDEGEALEQWAGVRRPAATQEGPEAAGPGPAASQPRVEAPAEPRGPRGLREMLLADLGQRLRVSPEQLQVTFAPQDQKLLALSEPIWKFQVDGRRARGLGDVAWDVVVMSDLGGGTAPLQSRKTTVSAYARAWQEQLVVVRPVNHRQVIRAEDVASRRALVERWEEEALLHAEQAVGQPAARDLRPGMVLTARMVEALPLAQSGQLVTVLLSSGGVHVTTVARAQESGGYGQTIRVRNEVTNDSYQVTLVGPQVGRLDGSARGEGRMAGGGTQ